MGNGTSTEISGWFYSGLTAFCRAILVSVQSAHPQKSRTGLASSDRSYDDEGLGSGCHRVGQWGVGRFMG